MLNKQGKTANKLKSYLPIGLTAFSVLASAILFFFLLYKWSIVTGFLGKMVSILQPIIFGLVIAYLLSPVEKLVEKHISAAEQRFFSRRKKIGKSRKSISRQISILISLIFAIVLLYVLGALVIPQITESITKLAADMPGHVQTFIKWSDEFLKNNKDFADISEEIVLRVNEYFEGWVQDNLLLRINTMVSQFVLSITNVVGVLFNIIIGIIISIYILNSRETFIGQSKKLIYSIFSERQAALIIDTTKRTNLIFGKFITGKLIDSLIIGCICYIVMSILNMPYTLLISVLVGVTNIIPFFGPFIGAIPSAFIILLVSPMQCLYFIIFIIILQQIDGNIIGPKIIGDSTGLSPFWIITAILVSGELFGFIGMIIGVPLFGVIYYIVKSLTEYRLTQKNLSTDTADYMPADEHKTEKAPKTPDEKVTPEGEM